MKYLFLFLLALSGCKPFLPPEEPLSQEERRFKNAGRLFGEGPILSQQSVPPSKNHSPFLFFRAANLALKNFPLMESSYKQRFIETDWHELEPSTKFKVIVHIGSPNLSKQNEPFSVLVFGKKLQDGRWIAYNPCYVREKIIQSIKQKVKEWEEKPTI